MVYRNNLVCAIKINGNVLKEQRSDGDTLVTLPFGSEYSILIKNLNSVRAKVKVSIDGSEATSWIVLSPNSDLDLERFLKSSNLNSGNKFKFIERTEQIEKHRGIKADDGIIRIEYAFEKIEETETIRRTIVDEHIPSYPYPWNWPHYPYYAPRRRFGNYTLGSMQRPRPSASAGSPIRSSGASTPTHFNGMMKNADAPDVTCFNSTFSSETSCLNDAGITVEGGISNQQFHWTSDFVTFNSQVLILRLRGQIGETKVRIPLTVKTKQECKTCGKKSRRGEPFCASCGQSLQLV